MYVSSWCLPTNHLLTTNGGMVTYKGESWQILSFPSKQSHHHWYRDKRHVPPDTTHSEGHTTLLCYSPQNAEPKSSCEETGDKPSGETVYKMSLLFKNVKVKKRKTGWETRLRENKLWQRKAVCVCSWIIRACREKNGCKGPSCHHCEKLNMVGLWTKS